ncbi:MAG: 30S ribosomal protein S9, small subunit ribosomal protein S9 [candidate division Kazan bacterium GW2011_GWA1_50_15]|uniref:Small ribosomal subunit protein uS9 n=2 Tax=Bacteria division Kazan-3B-28 TaxID=1798534 RepID=A0A0G1X6F6_UNCK3|nr:MAG: 30S ribosomal protein S9, small subunit ribosomal protein S9 [candidate division Kazan bacterium GW2011_GWA1_50_15]KKW25427.1 MAG: 30S ribosomal protein S9 [candidate division Kazan bacterium GW2011_GWC1_52_13]KKW26733.1 MAG: 30S ribosomal protein S9 [candidate division Kazan bacterium GW2011_GWB1_52_7]HAV65731.1 30S ribosomal protein S9 [Patescibacteria group bacterium]HCR42897.1 30S ribosomal protein S9 [Patescibacteria group bacterium]
MESTHVFTGQYFYGTGRRKTATARVRLYKGKDGKLVVNNQKGDHYFNPAHLTEVVIEPLKLTGMQKSFDVSARVSGGGIAAQAEAVRHGIARALVAFDVDLKTSLKKAGLLTRDARAKERKKFGLKRARRAPQFSKR